MDILLIFDIKIKIPNSWGKSLKFSKLIYLFAPWPSKSFPKSILPGVIYRFDVVMVAIIVNGTGIF